MLSCKKKIVEETKIIYPESRQSDQVDDYFGTKVADPYHWLENDTASEVEEWVKVQNSLTRNYLDTLPYLESIRKRLREIWNYPKYGVPQKQGDYYFYFKNDGMQAQSVLYYTKDLNATPEVFLDPNTFSEDGTVSLTQFSVSNDGKYAGYGISRGGSDWNEFFVVEIESRKLMKDHLKWIKFSGMAWYKDGFFYSRYDEPAKGKELSSENLNNKVYYHKLGTAQSQDKLIHADSKNPKRSFSVITTDDERFLFINAFESTNGNSIAFMNLAESEKKLTYISEEFSSDFEVINNSGDTIYINTNKDAKNYKIIAVNTKAPSINDWIEIIPQRDEPINACVIIGNKIIVDYLSDVKSKVLLFNLDGKVAGEVKLPGPGTVSGFSGKKEDSTAFYAFTSFVYPTVIFKYDVPQNKSSMFRKSEINFKTEDYVTEQVLYSSKDGTEVPMFLTYKKGMKRDGSNPVLLYGYGGFNISVKPSFSISNLIFLENGGIYAQANIRGGGEYGAAWHEAGKKLKKQNVFDDFIAAAEFLINEKYTNSEKIAIRGGSNGGLLVGACMTQRPDLFKVAIPEVGVMDMLKFHKFTIGYFWIDEYGSSDNEDEFKKLYAYSPLHNIKEGVEYPATLVLTADHDDRVVPAHSFKFIAALQKNQKGLNPVLIRIESTAGHGAGTPTEKQIEYSADIWAFIFKNLNIKAIY